MGLFAIDDKHASEFACFFFFFSPSKNSVRLWPSVTFESAVHGKRRKQ